MDIRLRNTVKYVVSAILAGAFLYWAFRSLDFAEFWRDLCRTRWGYAVPAFAAAVLALVFRAERWRLQLQMLDSDIARRDIWHGSNIGNFLNLLLPGVGEFSRCAFVRTSKSTYDKTFGTILVERSFDVLAVFVLFVLSFALQRERLTPFVRDYIVHPFSDRFDLSFRAACIVGVALLAALCLSVWFGRRRFSLFRKICDAFSGIFSGVRSFFGMRRPWLFALYTIGIWMSYVLMSWFILLSVPGLEGLSLSDALFISAVGNLASVIPTPGNLGPYHWLVGMALSVIYLGAGSILPVGLLFATLGHGTHAVLVIILGFISFICVSVRKKKTEN